MGVDVSIIIVNYNTLEMTKNCIESVVRFTKKNSCEIILVDNGSTDGSEEFFSCMNSFGIRHKGKSQVKIHYTKRNAVYDKLFKMALYVLQTPDVNEYKDEMKALREKKS